MTTERIRLKDQAAREEWDRRTAAIDSRSRMGTWYLSVYGRLGGITGAADRRTPNKATADRIRAKQGNRCLYCDWPIGATVVRGAHEVQLRSAWDHRVPYAYSHDNSGANFVLSCHVCNGIKSSKVFETVDAARAYIASRRIAKGYVMEKPPPVRKQGQWWEETA